MIKIDIDDNTRKEIEQMYLQDARSAPKGIFKMLTSQQVKNTLQKDHKAIYEALYHTATGELREDEVDKLLLAGRKELEKYISRFKSYAARKKESDYLLNHVFKYKNYARRTTAYEISQKMNVTVCPYCNRQYIFTVVPSKGRVRPQFDHFFPKNNYPYLALSLYNMVPSCSVCNMAKSSLDTHNVPILYPFDEEMGYSASFEMRIKKRNKQDKRDKRDNYVKIMQGLSNGFVINLDTSQAKKAAEINNQMEQLHLNSLYNKHTDYVMDILKSKHINTAERINEIQKTFPQLFHSVDEVKNMLYMTDLRKESWGKRPLSKLTHDIDMQLERGRVELGGS